MRNRETKEADKNAMEKDLGGGGATASNVQTLDKPNVGGAFDIADAGSSNSLT